MTGINSVDHSPQRAFGFPVGVGHRVEPDPGFVEDLGAGAKARQRLKARRIGEAPGEHVIFFRKIKIGGHGAMTMIPPVRKFKKVLFVAGHRLGEIQQAAARLVVHRIKRSH